MCHTKRPTLRPADTDQTLADLTLVDPGLAVLHGHRKLLVRTRGRLVTARAACQVYVIGVTVARHAVTRGNAGLKTPKQRKVVARMTSSSLVHVIGVTVARHAVTRGNAGLKTPNRERL